jgi:hypothetical protein
MSCGAGLPSSPGRCCHNNQEGKGGDHFGEEMKKFFIACPDIKKSGERSEKRQ